MDRYPPEHAPESCHFYEGVRLVTRAYWDNSDGVGLDYDLYLRHGWYAPSRIEFELPIAMHTTPPTVHAVVREEGMWHQPQNLISTRNEKGGAVRLGVAHCEATCTGYEDADIGYLEVCRGLACMLVRTRR